MIFPFDRMRRVASFSLGAIMTNIPAIEIEAAKPLSRWWTIGIPLAVTAILMPVIAAAVGILLLWMVHRWNIPFWSVCVIGVLMILAGTFFLWCYLRWFARRRFQFSIRGLLLFMAVFALFFSLFWSRLSQIWGQQRALAHIEATGGRYSPLFNVPWENRTWLQEKYNFDPFVKVSELTIYSDDSISAILEHRDQFPDLARIYLENGVTDRGLEKIAKLRCFPKFETICCLDLVVTDAALEHIAKCSVLKTLPIYNATQISDRGLEHLQALRELEYLNLGGDGSKSSRITDAGLKTIGRMTQLRRLVLDDLSLTDAGLDEIGKLTNLRLLVLGRLSITDAGLKHLTNLAQLETLRIDTCSVTKKGIVELGRRLPDCRILLDYEDVAEHIGQLDVWQVGGQEHRLKRLTDSAQIVKIMDYIKQHSWTATVPNQEKRCRKEERLDGIRLDFRGQNRCFFSILLQKEECYHEESNGRSSCWSSCPVRARHEKEFFELLGLDYAQYFGKAK
jgi:hypothetical protein